MGVPAARAWPLGAPGAPPVSPPRAQLAPLPGLGVEAVGTPSAPALTRPRPLCPRRSLTSCCTWPPGASTPTWTCWCRTSTAGPTRPWGSAATSLPAASGSRPPPTEVPPSLARAPRRLAPLAAAPRPQHAAPCSPSPEFSQEDMAKSLLHMISNDIGQLACLYARLHRLDRVYFGGFFIRGHPVTMRTITYSINFFSKVTGSASRLGHRPGLRSCGDPQGLQS